MTLYHAMEHRRSRIPGKVDPKAIAYFVPTQLSGCLMWMDAADLALSDGQRVATWVDKSSYFNNWSQSTDASRPIYRINATNDRPGLQFTGSEFMFFTLNMSTMRTAFLVGRSNGGTYQTCFGHTNSYEWHPGQGTNWLDPGWASANLTGGVVRQNGVSQGSPGTAVRPTVSTVASFHTIGDVNSNQFGQDRGNGHFWIGYFSEIIVYDSALSNDNANLVLQYLSAKYEIAVTLL